MFLKAPKGVYGIRDVDGEYNDVADIVALSTMSPVHAHVNRLLEFVEQARLASWEASSFARVEALKQFEKREQEKFDQRMKISRERLHEEWSEIRRKDEKKLRDIFQEVEDLGRIQQLESELAHKVDISEAEAAAALEAKKKEIELERLERKRLEEEEERQIAEEKLRKEKARLDLQLRQQEEEAARLAQEKLDQEQKIASASAGSQVPAEFQGCIFYEDLLKYSNSQDSLDQLKLQTNHITSKSKFYKAAVKVVNGPLNQISSATRAKIDHFTDLLKGNRVHVPGLDTPFSIADEKMHGDIFVKNLLAFRFVKKAEAEASENRLKRENLNYLAVIGVALVKRFPDFEELLQAHFYKACPFLVPFSYPRNGMDIRAYGAALGHHISIGDDNNKSLEASITQTLLDKLSGYCMLYGFMVRNMDSQPLTENHPNPFFFPSEVWRILATTLSLDPQEEVTATILHSLLEILNERLLIKYGVQYAKLLSFLKKVYLDRIRNVTSKGRFGSLTRLELLLEKLIR